MKRLTAKFDPKLLNFDKKTTTSRNCAELLNGVVKDPELHKRVTTGDERWVYDMTSKPRANNANGSYLESQDRSNRF